MKIMDYHEEEHKKTLLKLSGGSKLLETFRSLIS